MKEISFRNDVLPLKNKLFRLALRITLNREEAEDVVQDTMIKVWNARERWQEFGIHRSTTALPSPETSRSIASRRKKIRMIRLEEEKMEQPDTASTPSERMIQKDKLDIVRKMIDELPEKQRSCLQLQRYRRKGIQGDC